VAFEIWNLALREAKQDRKFSVASLIANYTSQRNDTHKTSERRSEVRMTL